jgi:hypothetical protein
MFFWGVYVPALLPAFLPVVMAWIITCILSALIWPLHLVSAPFFLALSVICTGFLSWFLISV